MLVLSIILFCLAILLGAFLLSYVLQKKEPPKAIVFAHGISAALGFLVLLIFALTTERTDKHWENLGVFAVVVMVGIYLFSRDIRHKKVPRWLAVVHGSVAVLGVIWLFIRYLN